jgi:predicted N-formylglutamate amidohydrolase
MFNVGDSAAPQRGVGTATNIVAQEPVHIENAGGLGRAIIVCDHASNHIPSRLHSLGLSGSDLFRHIAWDPGALGVARVLARRLDAPLVASRVSRLVVDCNRDPAMFDSIPEVSEETAIPGNRNLPHEERARRIRDVYEPFHEAVGGLVSAKLRTGPVAVISVHSFTPIYKGHRRPWHVGILYDRDTRLSAPVLAALAAEEGLVVGANEPYNPGDRVYHTLDRHAQSRGCPSLMIEIRNDLLTDLSAEAAWGSRLAGIIKGALDGAFDTEPELPAA